MSTDFSRIGGAPAQATAQGTPASAGHRGRGPVELQADGAQGVSPPAGPAHRPLRQVARAGAQVEHGERPASRHAPQHSIQPVMHGGAAAEPAVGARDVSQRPPDGFGVGGGVVEQLDPKRGDPQASVFHSSELYPPR